MKKYLIIPIPLIIGIGIFSLVLGFTGLESIFLSFRKFTFQNLMIFFVISTALIFTAVFRWNLIISEQGYKINFLKLATYKISAFSVNYITPFSGMGGEPVRAFLLKNHKLKTAHALTSVVLDKSIETFTDASLSTISIAFILLAVSVPEPVRQFLIAFLIITFASVAVFYALSKTKKAVLKAITVVPLKIMKRIRKFFNEVDEAIKYFLKHKKTFLVKIVAISAIQWGLTLLQFKAATMLIGFDAQITDLILIMIAAGLTSLIPVPAGIGVLEASQYSVFALIGAGGNLGIAFSLVIRMKDLIVSFLGFVFLSHEGLNKIVSIVRGD